MVAYVVVASLPMFRSSSSPAGLILFTRYPQPGTTKTRLIPALGAEGAAQLQQHMTEYVLAQVLEAQGRQPFSIEIHFAGGTIAQMQSWLGSKLTYRPQGAGSLGDRMGQALQAGFESGLERLVMIGADCPLEPHHITYAFDCLRHQDLVLGPALDGGYYLIGLRCMVPELFSAIPWSTAQVLPQTLAIAQQLRLSFTCLDWLTDIDRPEDLKVWQQLQGSMPEFSLR